jgi:hypothetical protein
LTPVALAIGPGTYVAGDPVRLGFDIQNFGTNTAVAPAYDIYFGNSTTPDPADLLIGSFVSADAVGNSTVSVFDRMDVPLTAVPGTSYLHVSVDPNDLLGEYNRANNVASLPITIVP